MEPGNVIMGDMSMGVDLPEAQIDENELIEEKKMAKYSKTAEFKRIQNHCKERIAFYQQYLPDGKPVGAASKEEREAYWAIANIINGEFTMLMNMFENAAEVVKNSERV